MKRSQSQTLIPSSHPDCMFLTILWVLFLLPVGFLRSENADESELRQRARKTLEKAVSFFVDRVAVEGGYVYQVSADLKYREGEGDAGQRTVWVQPPGTPAVGLALIEAYERTGEKYLLEGALKAARCLIRGQLHSGGWQNRIDFDPELRTKLAYKVDGPRRAKARNWSSFDDDQTQAAIRFMSKCDRALRFQDAEIHDATQTALKSVLMNQFPNGAWGQGFEALDPTHSYPVQAASYPSDWPKTFPKEDYWKYYTINDNALVRTIDTLWLAFEIYGDEELRRSALRGADFLLLAQMPEPQPAWAQQYDFSMHPVWARKFEPPAISGGESQSVIDALMDTFERTGDRKYLDCLDRALDYLERSQLSDGRLARFYELKTNKPLYFTKQYELTYSDNDVPTHYGFKIPNTSARLRKRLDKLKSQPLVQDAKPKQTKEPDRSRPSDDQIRTVLNAMDDQGRWVEMGSLKYIQGASHDGKILSSNTFIRNVDLLSRFIAK